MLSGQNPAPTSRLRARLVRARNAGRPAMLLLLLAVLAVPFGAIAIGSPSGAPARNGAHDLAPLPESVPIDAAAMRSRTAGASWYVVTLKGRAADPRDLVAAASVAGPRPPIGFVYRTAINGFSTALSDAQADLLRKDPNVLAVTPNYSFEALDQTIPAGINRIEAAPSGKNAIAHIDGIDTRVNVGVAVIDSAVDKNHPDLNVPLVWDCTGEATIVAGQHGTHVAGTIGALDNTIGVVGVAPGAPIYSYKVFPNAGGFANLASILCALNRIAQNPAQTPVANMSLGIDIGSPADDGNCGNTDHYPLHIAICGAVRAGVTIVAAAGNDCANAANSIPAGYREVITVAAFFDSNGSPDTAGAAVGTECGPSTVYADDEEILNFSNWGAPVDIIAPGGFIYSTVPSAGAGSDYGYLSGTSMAAPHVAGAAALYIAKYGRIGPAAVQAGLITRREQKTLTTVWTGGRPATMAQGVLNVNDAGPWGTVLPAATATPIPPADTTAPTVSITSPKKKAKVKSPVSFAVTAADAGSGVASVELQQCSGNSCKKIAADASSPYTFRKKLKPGAYSFAAVAIDRAGNRGTSSKISITVIKTKDAPAASNGRGATGKASHAPRRTSPAAP